MKQKLQSVRNTKAW